MWILSFSVLEIISCIVLVSKETEAYNLSQKIGFTFYHILYHTTCHYEQKFEFMIWKLQIHFSKNALLEHSMEM